MKQWNLKMLVSVVEKNGYEFTRRKGGHIIYRNPKGYIITVPRNLKCKTAQKIVKQHKLTVD